MEYDYPTQPEKTLQLSNYDIDAIVTPINAIRLRQLLQETQYDAQKTEFLFEGFTKGFSIGYTGPQDVKITSNNLSFRVGDKYDLWHKIMLEVQAKRYAGPFKNIEEIPFPGDGTATGWIQAPCGLVPKSGNKTRLINHHSYPHGRSLNDGIDDAHAKVVYQDFQDAIKIATSLLESNPDAPIFFSKCDGKNAFRVLSLAPFDRRWQVLKAVNPLTGEEVFFVDLCISFGNRASCFLYENFSKAIAHIYTARTGVKGVSYLDDALQVGVGRDQTNRYLAVFLDICSQINMPISEEKTVFATQIIIFLGMIINAVTKTVEIPDEKVIKAMNQIQSFLDAKKVTVLQVQQITGLLNFFCRAIVPGRAFTRRLYAAYVGNTTRPHHHVRVTNEMKLDLTMWNCFLTQDKRVYRRFVDFDSHVRFSRFPIFSDAAKAVNLGYSTCFLKFDTKEALYCFDRWNAAFLELFNPSVQFLELLPLAIGVVLFAPYLVDSRVQIHCDNQAVVQMVNNGASSCKHCMLLIRRITLCCLQNNISLEVVYISSEDNFLADFLSRNKEDKFLERLPEGLLPVKMATPSEFLPFEKFYLTI